MTRHQKKQQQLDRIRYTLNGIFITIVAAAIYANFWGWYETNTKKIKGISHGSRVTTQKANISAQTKRGALQFIR